MPDVETTEEIEAEGIVPSLVAKPKAQVVDEGATVLFECSVAANPAPEVFICTFNVSTADSNNIHCY